MLNLHFGSAHFLSLFCGWLFIFSGSVNAMLPVMDISAITQLGHQLTQLKLQTESVQHALKTLSPDQYQWSQVQPLLHELDDIMQKTQGLNYKAKRIHEAFQEAYPGYQPPDHLNEHYRKNVNMAQHTFQGVLQSLAKNAEDFEDENRRLAFLQRQAQHAQGQTQAIQASSQISSELVSQLQLLRQTLMTQTDAHIAYYATQIQQEASRRAAFEQVIHRGSVDIPAYGSSGEMLDMPKF